MTSQLIGQHMNIKRALDLIQFDDAIPVFEFRGYIYHIDATGRGLGNLHYTKFQKNLKDAIHSVQMPYSNTFTVGECIDRGEGLQKKLPPAIDQLPAATYSIIQCDTPSIIVKKNI